MSSKKKNGKVANNGSESNGGAVLSWREAQKAAAKRERRLRKRSHVASRKAQ